MSIRTLLHSRRVVRQVEPALGDRFGRGEISSIARLGTLVDLEPGAPLMVEGAPGEAAYFIADGSVEVRRHERRIAQLGIGDLVGEGSLLTGRPRNATVAALGPVRALRIDEREFRWLRLESETLRELSDELLARRD